MKSQKSLDVSATQMERVPAGISDAIPLDVQHNGRDGGIAGQDCPLDDGASFALCEALRGDRSISAIATENRISPPRTSETCDPNPPLHTQGFSSGDPDIDMAPSGKSPLEEMDCVQQPQLIGSYEPSSASPNVLQSSPVRRPDASRTAFGISADTPSSEGPMSDRAHSSRSSATTDAADTEGSDGDEPPRARRRRRTRLRTRGSVSPPPPFDPQSSAHSVEVKPMTAVHRRRRLRRRHGTRPNPPTPKTDDTRAGLTIPMSSRGDDERWPVQCFIERKMVGSQEMITIQVPALDLRAISGRVSVPSPLDDTSQTVPNWSDADEGRHGARFSRAQVGFFWACHNFLLVQVYEAAIIRLNMLLPCSAHLNEVCFKLILELNISPTISLSVSLLYRS